jgi:asparagine synthase (glutamine-hydrolysing)
MCGIAGQARSDGRPVARSLLERMCEMQAHRGPDSLGVYLDGSAGLGVQRLRVIDLDTGDQPLYNEDRSIAVVLNGEIYNYRELRDRLRRRGHRFSSTGDTEVIAHLYEESGPRCVHELHGMFAFAVWDARRRRMFLARDRIGKKPLLYSHRPDALSFASEMRALLQDPEVPRELDYASLDTYLTYEYLPAPHSAFRSVRKLPPGCHLTYEQGRVSIERYWRLRYDREPASGDPVELQEELGERIRTAVRRRLISDVPLGALLSGGIDSSTVVAAMAEASPAPVKTFSIGFDEASFNELPNARLVAGRFATDHHEMVVRPDALSIIPKVVRHYGEPFADSSSVPSFLVSELARRDVTVALNGDGGDEGFAGYDRYVMALRMNRVAALLPSPVRRAMRSVAERSAESLDARPRLNRARRVAHALSVTSRGRYGLEMSLFAGPDRERLYSPEFVELIGGVAAPRVIEDAWDRTTGTSPVDVMLEVDVNTYLPDDLLVKMDIASMAHSLEARSPFLDHELMEFAASLPGSMKLRGAERKVVLRQALRGWIPDPILDGPKRGFALPMVGEWFRGELRDHVVEVLTDKRALSRGYFREPALRGLLDRHLSGREDNGRRLWALMMLEEWHREFVDAPSPALNPLHA